MMSMNDVIIYEEQKKKEEERHKRLMDEQYQQEAINTYENAIQDIKAYQDGISTNSIETIRTMTENKISSIRNTMAFIENNSIINILEEKIFELREQLYGCEQEAQRKRLNEVKDKDHDGIRDDLDNKDDRTFLEKGYIDLEM